MKKLFFLTLAVISLASCASGAKLVNTATYQKMTFQPYVTPVQVDLEVSPNKIEHFMNVTANVRLGGYDNIVATAVKEALEANGNADVLVGLQTQVKYSEKGEIVSILVSGFPAKYVNFRNCESMPLTPAPEPENTGMALFGKKK